VSLSEQPSALQPARYLISKLEDNREDYSPISLQPIPKLFAQARWRADLKAELL
jgi:hypothetical protein